eukprot:TRINITY_DN2828_c0_g1_i2.p1 TRINITY_DN2828_c0_g1~~TRINITY_DN2828_c0_g1_i2.p1  ORF type:complete len:260 (-),score=21.67 TRINITY_DN2828_c0_g1_i2:97-876(-)
MNMFKRARELIYLPSTKLSSLRENFYVWNEDFYITSRVSTFLCVILNIALVASPWFLRGVLDVTLLMVSVINAIYLAVRRKTYQLPQYTQKNILHNDLLNENTHINFPSPNMRLDTLSLPTREGPEELRYIVSLDIWMPDTISLKILKFFSPPQVVSVLLSDHRDFSGVLKHYVISLFVFITIYGLIYLYQGLLKDKEIFFGELYQEFNEFTMSKLNIRKYEKAIQVDMDSENTVEWVGRAGKMMNRDVIRENSFQKWK